jgi:GT2 family glycosyltransferase
VNAGVLAARTPKVIILNNDTHVLPGWDAPLLTALDDETVFAAGPLSNAASYQSVPEQRSESGWAVNEYPAAIRPRLLAGALAECFGDRTLDWPVLNGFCYAVRAASFIDVGMLDQGSFPRGYGEEVDLMLRSTDAGYRNVIVPSSFVYHYKSKTFAGESAALSSASNVVLNDRWGERLPDTVAQMDDSEEMNNLRVDVRELISRLTVGEGS